MGKTWRDYVQPSLEVVRGMGLDPLPVYFEEVPQETLNRIVGQGLPVMLPHWTVGRDTLRARSQYWRGAGRVAEVVFHLGDEALAYISTAQGQGVATLTVPHVYGHSHVFRFNAFQGQGAGNTLRTLQLGLSRLTEIEATYGFPQVEKVADLALALAPQVELEEPEPPPPTTPPTLDRTSPLPDKLHRAYSPLSSRLLEDQHRTHQYQRGEGERDVLRWLIVHSPLPSWQKEVLSLYRAVALYWKRAAITKYVHEGFASWVHQRALNRLRIPPEWVFDISLFHARVLYPSLGNPYWVGYQAFCWMESELGVEGVIRRVRPLSDALLFDELARSESFIRFLLDQLDSRPDDGRDLPHEAVIAHVREALGALSRMLYSALLHPSVTIYYSPPSTFQHRAIYEGGNRPDLHLVADMPLEIEQAVKVAKLLEDVARLTLVVWAPKLGS